MHLPTEYVLRNDRIRSMLQLPCSLFLLNKNNDDKVALLIYQGKENNLWVTRYNLSQMSPGKIPSPNSECYILTSELFTSKFTILPDYKPLKFLENPYDFSGKQESSMPEAIFQEKEYVSIVDNYFTSKSNRIKRENWLWSAFEELNVTNELRAKFYDTNIPSKQDIIKTISSSVWKLWETWKTIFLSCEGVAAELIFNKTYNMPVPFTPIEPVYEENLYNYMVNGIHSNFYIPRRRS